MPITNKVYSGSNGIPYTKEVDGPLDYDTLDSSTYFRDKTDNLIRFKDSSGTITGMFSKSVDVVSTNLIHVSTTGDDNAAVITPYSIATPFLTLGAAINTATAGDMIVVYPGDYTIAVSPSGFGLAKDGVDWYFHSNAKVTTSMDAHFFWDIGFSIGWNVYGLGDFVHTVGSRSCVQHSASIPVTFECNSLTCKHICVLYSASNVNNTFCVKVRSKIDSDGNSAVVLLGAGNTIITCPFIINRSTAANSTVRITNGNVIITAARIINRTANGTGLQHTGTNGAFVCTADYIDRVVVSNTRGCILNVGLIDNIVADTVSLTHTGTATNVLHTRGYAQLGSVQNFTGSGIGEAHFASMNLDRSYLFDGNIGEGRYYIRKPLYVGTENTLQATFTVSGSGSQVHLIGSWRVADHQWLISSGVVYVDGKVFITSNTELIPFVLSGSGKLSINGTIETARNAPIISMVAGTGVILNGGTLITLNNANPPFDVSGAAQNIKVLSGGLNTNYTGHDINLDVLASVVVEVTDPGVLSSIRLQTPVLGVFINIQEADIVTYNTTAAMAQRLAALINVDPTLTLTATQLNPGVDSSFTISGDDPDALLVHGVTANVTTIDGIITGSYGLNNTTGGIIIQDNDVESHI